MKFSIDNIANIKKLIKELATGLTRLSFMDNFESFEKTVTIPATSVLQIRNELTFIPSKRIITRKDVAGDISDSTLPWTSNYVYLENHGANPVTLNVTFMR